MVIVFQAEDCSMWTVSSFLMLENALMLNIILFLQSSQVPDLESSILVFFTNHSSFPTQGASFTHSSLTCSSSSLTFTSTLIYSSDDGFLTATNLISLMEAQIMSGRGTATLTVRGVELPIRQFGDANKPSSSSLLTGLFFGGAGASSLIWVTVIMVLIM